MTKEDFLAEVKDNGLFTNSFETMYKEFCSIQSLAVETLKYFHLFCQKHNIHYQLAYGSLLGAVRDGGQIPWDYDADVFVPHNERERLVNALKSDIDKNYYFNCIENNKKCHSNLLRICPRGYNINVIHVDVFFLVGTPNDAKERRQFAQRLSNIQRIYFKKKVNPYLMSYGNFKVMFNFIRNKIKLINISSKKLESEREMLCQMYDIQDSKFVVDSGISACDKSFPSSFVYNTILFDTTNGQFYITKDFNTILTEVYGNYNKPLPIEQRILEVEKSYNHFTKFGKKEINI